MTQVFETQKLTSLGDFMLSANDNKTTVKIVMGHIYKPSISTNLHSSESDTLDSRLTPRVEKFPLETAIASLDMLTEKYKSWIELHKEAANKVSDSSWLGKDFMDAHLDRITQDITTLDTSKKELGKLQLNK